ncbi:hypothetical protein BaRGS_00023493 [Batillaria attramentaria]|uniref:Uncharacterized protein n=1 Tax=Batillaria attramentaria TaxID=370345 RepID=A0ABD0KE94_9CAEN
MRQTRLMARGDYSVCWTLGRHSLALEIGFLTGSGLDPERLKRRREDECARGGVVKNDHETLLIAPRCSRGDFHLSPSADRPAGGAGSTHDKSPSPAYTPCPEAEGTKNEFKRTGPVDRPS